MKKGVLRVKEQRQTQVQFYFQCSVYFVIKKTLWISQKTGKRKDRCVTRTAETSIKESVVKKKAMKG